MATTFSSNRSRTQVELFVRTWIESDHVNEVRDRLDNSQHWTFSTSSAALQTFADNLRSAGVTLPNRWAADPRTFIEVDDLNSIVKELI